MRKKRRTETRPLNEASYAAPRREKEKKNFANLQQSGRKSGVSSSTVSETKGERNLLGS